MKRRIEHSIREKIAYQFESNSMLQIATVIAIMVILHFATILINAGWWGIGI